MSEHPIRIFEIETKLAEDQDGSYRSSMASELANELGELKREINAGLPPEEFQQASSYAAALERASAVIEKVWNAEHA